MHGVVSRTAQNDVVPVPPSATDLVVAVAAVDQVGGRRGPSPVVSRAQAEGVGPARFPGSDDVITSQRDDDIMPGCQVDDVVAGSTDDGGQLPEAMMRRCAAA